MNRIEYGAIKCIERENSLIRLRDPLPQSELVRLKHLSNIIVFNYSCMADSCYPSLSDKN